MWWAWRWLLFAAVLAATTALPVPDETIDTSTKLIGSSVVTSVSVIMGHEDGNSEKSERKKLSEDLPPSTVDMLKPEGFQFYTVDEKGQLITRQMTDSEIQSIIAAGGGPFPMETQDPQKTGENSTEGMKVADVVENVQKVLKGELNKPATAMGAMPTIPGHANDEWSSILPSILGGDSESAPVTLPEVDSEPMQEIMKQNVSKVESPASTASSVEKLPVTETSGTKTQETESPVTENVEPIKEVTKTDEMVKTDEKQNVQNIEKPEKTEAEAPKEPQETPDRPMIQVPVITADSVQPMTEDPSMVEEKPVYQILNTISADEVKEKDAQDSGEVKPAEKEPEKTVMVSVPMKETQDTSSTTEKIDSEAKKPEISAPELPMTAQTPVETKDELEPSSGSMGTDKIKEPAVDVQKVETPSLILEAPVEKPVDPVIKSEEKEPQSIPEVKPAPEEDKTDKKPAMAIEESPKAPSQQSETTTSAATVEQEVSEKVDLIPESISTIVDELISETDSDASKDVVKSEKPEAGAPADDKGDDQKKPEPETSLDKNGDKKPEVMSAQDEIKVQESSDKTEDNNSSGSEKPEVPDVKVTPPEVGVPESPESEFEPVFQMLPQIRPESTMTKTEPAAQTPSKTVENAPEKTEAASEASEIAPEETVPVIVDKIEEQPQSEKPENSIPVIEAAAPMATGADSTTDNKNDSSNTKATEETAGEKKPETLLTELADSVSSMISQVSETMPPMVPIPQKSTVTTEQPAKRVEDGAGVEEATTVKNENIKPTTMTLSEEADKPVVEDVHLPVEQEMTKPNAESDGPLVEEVDSPVEEESTKPEKSDPEMVMVEVKSPEPTTISSLLQTSDGIKTSEAVPTSSPESGNKLETPAMEIPSESSSDVKKTESLTTEKENIEETNVTTADFESIKIPEPSNDKEPAKPEDTETSKTDESKPEKIDAVVVKEETKTETDNSGDEAPIVRIDITEAKPTDSDPKNDDSTESSVVRIQLTNPIETIDQMIDSAPEVAPPVDVQQISLPDKDVLEVLSPQHIGSDLIAGTQSSNTPEINTPEDLPQMDSTTPDKNLQISNEPSVTEGAKVDSEDKTTLGTNADITNADKSEIENVKTAEAEVAQTAAEPKPVINNEVNKDSPVPEPEILKTSEQPDEVKPEKPAEMEAPVETVVNSASPVFSDEKTAPPAKSEDQEKPSPSTEKIVESATVISEEKPEEKPEKEPVVESIKTPVVDDTKKIVPEEVAVSTIVEVEKPVKELPEKMKDEKPEETNTKMEKPESVSENKSEADKTVMKINEAESETSENSVPVDLAVPASMQPDLQTSADVLQSPTPAAVSEDKKADITEAPQKVDEPVTAQTDSGIHEAESTEKKTELNDTKDEVPAEKESGDAPEAVKDSIEPGQAKPEEVKTEGSKSPSGENEPQKKVPSVDNESSASDQVQKEQPSIPLVRIDVSPEKNQMESSTAKIEEISDKKDVDNKKIEKPDMPVTTEMKVSAAEEPQKKIDDFAVDTSSAKPVEIETTITVLDSSAKAPAEADTEETKVEEPAAKEPEVVVEMAEESVKETVDKVESEAPEVTPAPVETTPTETLNGTKIEGGDIVKPVVRIDTTPHTAQDEKPLKTQEIRIQVNDTAVLVTKQQIPQNSESDEKKIQPTIIPDSKINIAEVSSQKPEKVEVSSQKPENVEMTSQSMEASNVEKPASIATSQQTDKMPIKQDTDEIKIESTSDHKKPIVDPYVKLGEKKQEQKPADDNIIKSPIPTIKKPGNTDVKKESEEKWTLIPQSEPYPMIKQQAKPSEEPSTEEKNENVSVPLEAHQSAVSLKESTRDQDEDISLFAKLCNELAFSFWISANKGLSTARSLALSPFGMTSMLAMVFLGARGPTSGQMNDLLKLDDVVTFNPHLVFQNVTDSVNLARGQGIANAAFVRELFADRLKAGRLLPFYKERAQQFYDGHVEEVNFATISDLARRRTNLLIRRQTGGRIRDFVKGNVMPLRSPLAALSANVFQTDCTGASSEGRDGEMYFAVLPAVRQRKLVPVPATVWRSGVLAGYEPGLDATVISLGGVGNLVSTIFVLPGQQGLAAPGDSLDHLEKRLLEGAFTNGVWDRLLKVLIPRMGLEVQVPKFSHRSVVNATAALKRMGLDDLFSRHADLKGINGIGNDLHLADMLQINLFSTCGDEVITGGRHHVEIYPASPFRGAREEMKSIEIDELEEDFKDSEDETEEKRTRRSLKVGEYIEGSPNVYKRSTSETASKQLIPEDKDDEERSQRSSNNSKEELFQLSKGKQNDRPMLRLDRPFLYFVRHNPTGMILHMGRFNPRLMP